MSNKYSRTERRNKEDTSIQIRAAQPSDQEGMKKVWQDVFGAGVFGGEHTYGDYLVGHMRKIQIAIRNQ